MIEILAPVYGDDDEIFDADAAEVLAVAAGLDGEGVAEEAFGAFFVNPTMSIRL